MSTIYDNWERLVAATLRREHLWQLFHGPSRTPSISSIASDFSSSSQLLDFPFEFSSSSSWYQQNPVPEIGVYGQRYNANDSEAKLRKDEKSQKIKELALGDIFVNGKPLSSRELNLLLRRRFLGQGISISFSKEGQKPSQIISAQLGLGGRLEQDASKGNTLVYVNNREITKGELRVLQLAGVRCYPRTCLWLTADGFYQEEGANYIKGNIWRKVGMKLLCSIFSLPFPSKSYYTSGELSVSDRFEERTVLQKILLVGCSGSGTSTIFKQAVFLYVDIPFLEDELEQIKQLIQSNIYGYIRILLEGHKQIEEANLNESREIQSANEHGLIEFNDAGCKESIYSFGPRLEAFVDWILQFTESSSSGVFSTSFIQATAPLIEELWRNPTFQEIFMRRSELQRLHSAADYFLERTVHIFKPEYEPSNMDILCAERLPSSLSCMDFSFAPPRDDEYQLIRPDGPGDNEMPFDMFGDVRIIIFCVSLCDYDQFVINDSRNSVNKMIYNRHWFECTVANPVFDQKVFLLLLTKYDLFEEKIKRIPLNQCDWFADFRPVQGRGTGKTVESLGEKGFQYIAVKFKTLYRDLTGGKLYVAKVNCLNQHSVDVALGYAREILKWEEDMSEYA
ncbi:G-protein alpha subunit (small G protein superfamily) [Handroanthus impetiginosus]|uniref:G-protein alpha subunit (Small G protein superfamily) n=1 Tax=Handroanthus impetiginosus TaxID=429701 RepID=A0A2G9HQ00_9LAMI|nr:G-protein alpha subunit (small G protein superfamily) [Handroanthus impetiginosus]